MKIALITDTHWGIRNDSSIMNNHMKRFLDEVFFPTLAREGITNIIHLGDLVDRRKYINYITAKRLRDDFLDPIQERGITMHIIAGNHDTFYKNTNNINSLVELIGDAKTPYPDLEKRRYPNIHIVYKKPVWLQLKDMTSVFLIPWICDENRQITMEYINKTTAPIALGHLELNGFEMYRGHISDHGDDPKIFDKFDLVCSGHYHTRSNNGNIHYLGAPLQFTWTDYNDQKGMHILNTHRRELTFIKNPYTIFNKFFYDDINKNMEEVIAFDPSIYKDCYVKVVVKNKTNPYWFDLVVDKLEKCGAADIQVVEDNFNLDLETDSDIVNEAEDTMSIIRKFIGGMNIKSDNKRVENIIQDLYTEAHNIS
jgi:DNA repair exonuclease SbcCD nuclease subunit